MTIPIGIFRALRRRSVIALSIVFVLCWSSGFIGAKIGAGEAPVTTVLLWRFLPLALVLAPWAVAAVGSRTAEPRREVVRQGLVGLLSQAGYLLSVYGAIGLGVSTGTTALIDGIQPLVVAALAGPVLGAVVSSRQWAGLVLGLAGVGTVTWADAVAPGTAAPWWAYLVPVGGMLSLVGATFLDRRARSSTPPLRALAIHCTVSVVVFATLALATGTAAPPATAGFWLATAWLVGLSTFGGYGLYWLLLDRTGITRVNTLMFLVPPVTAVWGAAMFGEPFTWATATGLAVALAATWVVSSERRPRAGVGTCSRRDSNPH